MSDQIIPFYDQALSDFSELDQLVVKPSQKASVGPKSVILLIDCSGSMDGYKLDQAKNGAIGFAKSAFQKKYRVGIVRFDSNAQLTLEPTNDLALVERSLGRLVADGTTNMLQGLQVAGDVLKKQNGERVIVMLTDGAPDGGTEDSTIAEGRKLKASGIEIMTIGVENANTDFLKRLATKTDLSSHCEPKLLAEKMTKIAGLLPG